MIVSIDPGEKVGIATWNQYGELFDRYVVDPGRLLSLLQTWEGLACVEELVVEEWSFQPGRTKGGDRQTTPRVIGMLEYFAFRQELPIHFQPSRILDIAAMHAGEKVRKGHYPDEISAYLHGHHYFVERGVIVPTSSV